MVCAPAPAVKMEEAEHVVGPVDDNVANYNDTILYPGLWDLVEYELLALKVDDNLSSSGDLSASDASMKGSTTSSTTDYSALSFWILRFVNDNKGVMKELRDSAATETLLDHKTFTTMHAYVMRVLRELLGLPRDHIFPFCTGYCDAMSRSLYIVLLELHEVTIFKMFPQRCC